MATWDKDTIIFGLVIPETGVDDETSHVVKVCPANSAYPTGAVTCTQCTGAKSRYYPSADLDDETHYDIYVDGINVGRIPAKKSYAPIGV